MGSALDDRNESPDEFDDLHTVDLNNPMDKDTSREGEMDDVHRSAGIARCCDKVWNDTQCEGENIEGRIDPADRDRWNRPHSTNPRHNHSENDVGIEHLTSRIHSDRRSHSAD